MMTIKYRSSYAEGGFLDDGEILDPVSGNEVPTGSLAEEVRDDIPAQLSEGEFVVPADVVRFIGLDKLMKMRETAKVGLANMEAEGQMGGSPAPMMEQPMMGEPMMNDDMEMDALIDGMDGEDFDSSVQTFAEGGSVIPNYKDYTGRDYNVAGTPEYRMYTNGTDFKNFTFIGGKPVEPIPEGWTPYIDDGEEEEGGQGEGDSVESTTQSTVNSGASGTAEMTRDYKNDTGPDGYQADLTRSTRIRSQRINALDAMIKPNMDQEATDLMFASMTPQAQELYNSRFKDPEGLDSYFSEGMGVADRFLLAQKTADSMNNSNGAIEQGSQYLPDGRPIEWKKMVGGIVKAFSGGLEIGALDEFGKLLDNITGERINTVGTTEPSAVDRPTYNQEYWSNFKGTPAELLAAQRKASEDMSGGLRGGWSINAYGNKTYKEPGTYDPFDHIAEVRANQENTKKLKADKIAAQNKAEADQIERQNEMDTLRERADKVAESKANDYKIEKERAAKQRAKSLAQKAAADKAAAAAKEAARQNALIRQRSGGGGDGDKGDNSPYKASPYSGYSKPNKDEGGRPTQSSSPSTSSGNGTSKYFKAEGGFIKKMRNDPTSGLASKKIAKQKAQAKKGALAAKRT